MSFNIAKNKPIILRVTLPENDSSKFIQAFVRDHNNVQLPGSPFTLNSLGDGRYFYKDEVNLIFPTSAIEVSAIYKIFDDSGFTIPTVDYTFQLEDVFRADEGDASTALDYIQDALTGIENAVTKVLTLEPGIEAEIELDDDSVEAEVDSDNTALEAEIEMQE